MCHCNRRLLYRRTIPSREPVLFFLGNTRVRIGSRVLWHSEESGKCHVIQLQQPAMAAIKLQMPQWMELTKRIAMPPDTIK